MNIFNTERTNILSVTYELLNEINVKVNKRTLSKCMQSHPEYPSLLAICDCLSALNVGYQVFKVEEKNRDSQNLPLPFISYSSSDEGSFYLVHEISNGVVTLSNEKVQNDVVTESEFYASWEGIVLHAQANESSGEPNYYHNYIQSLLHHIKLPLSVMMMLGIIIWLAVIHQFSWQLWSLATVKMTGLLVSILLLLHSINANHPLIRPLCGTGTKSDCNTILQSKEAKITPWLSWAEAGFFYFSSSLLVLLLFPVFAPVLFWINIVALPFTIYSINYQYRFKKWCILCISTQVLLMMECVIFSFMPGTFSWDLSQHLILLYPVVFCFISPVLIWGLAKTIIRESTLVKPLRQELNTFRYNSEIFSLVLMNQNHYAAGNELKPVVLGNPKAQTLITVISNPFCRPCGEAHMFIDEWLKQRNDIQVKIILLVNTKSPDVRIARHMIALSLLKDRETVAAALKDWYAHKHKSYKSWAEKYPVVITKAARTACIKQQGWARTSEINFTPAILVNGYLLPEPYRLEDLKYLIN